MYEAFFGFREKPFNLTPDPKFLYPSPKHYEAFAHLDYGLKRRGGFMVVTGEVGTGKTTLCRYFLERLDANTVSAFILYPALGTTELLRSVNHDLGVSTEGASQKELIDALHEFLLTSRQQGKNIVLVIDEAQNLSRDVLEQVRLISNLETATEKLIQIVLIGQNELNEMLAKRDLRQLAQRVTARYHLTPLSREEMALYIHHRLAVAGTVTGIEFTNGALRVIHRYSKGVPRLINLACDRALLGAYVLETDQIDADIARRATREVSAEGERPWYRRLSWGLTSLVASVTVVLLALSLARAGAPEGDRPWVSRAASLWSGDDVAADAGRGRGDDRKLDGERFQLRLVTLSANLSTRAAATVLLERWGLRPSEGLADIEGPDEMAALAGRAALEYSAFETSFDQLRALNTPAVLELAHPSRDAVLFATLTGLRGDNAVVHFAPGDFEVVPLDELASFWTRRAHLFWRDFDKLVSADVSTRDLWARGRLRALGALDSQSIGETGALRGALESIQARVYIEPTGDVDRDTQMALYSIGGDYPTPRLVDP